MIEIAVLWIAYYALHSFLASSPVKNRIGRWIGNYFRYYRLSYNLLSVVLFFGIYVYQQQMSSTLYFHSSGFMTTMGWGIVVIGVVIGAIAFMNYSGAEFIGFVQIKSKEDFQDTLRISSLNKIVRHPVYFASLLIFIGWFLKSPTDTNLAFVLPSVIYLFVGGWFEEKRLVNEFGLEYLAYKKSVKMIIPYVL